MLHRWGTAKSIVLVVGLLVVFAGAASAATTTYNWTTSGGANGAIATATTQVTGLTAFSAGSILSFGGPGRGLILAGIGGIDFTIDITTNNGGSWITVWNGSLPGAGSFNLSTIGPISFGATYSVNGIRFTATLQGGSTALGGWDNLNGTSPGGPVGQTTFTLDTRANPEPATLLLVGAGVGGLAWRRHRRRKRALSA